MAVIIEHNFIPDKFMWLWAKYAKGFNWEKHCTACVKGNYSKKFSKTSNPELIRQQLIAFDEFSDFQAIYICGVAKQGYSVKKNYQHNVHIPILPKMGKSDQYDFEGWKVRITNGILLPITPINDLPENLKGLPPQFLTCRIFRWAAGFFNQNQCCNNS